MNTKQRLTLLSSSFPAAKHSCVQCFAEFNPSTHIHSILVEEEHKVQRCDFCAPCFTHFTQTENQITWKLIKQEKPRPQKLTWKEIDIRALHLLKELLNQELHETVQIEINLLALHLLRRKKLLLMKELDDAFVYQLTDTQEVISFPKISPTAISLEVQKALHAKLFSADCL